MKIRSFSRRALLACAALSLLPVPLLEASEQAVASRPVAAGTAHLEHLAEAGKFAEVLARLQSDFTDLQTPTIASLIQDLERFTQQRREQTQARRAAYEAALVEVQEHLDKGDVRDAAIAAFDAQALAEDKAAALLAPPIAQAIEQATEQARAAEEEHDWIEALALYRALDLLHNDYATFHDDVKRVAKHVSVLQLYVPAKLKELYEAQARRRAQQAQDQEAEQAQQAEQDGAVEAEGDPLLDQVAAIAVEEDAWQERLRGIEPAMIDAALAEAATRHVEHGGYQPMLKGTLESLLVFLRTPHLAATFPSFAEVQKLKQFEQGVEEMLRLINEAKAPLGTLESMLIVQNIVKLNEATLKLPESVLAYELAEGAMGTLDDFSSVIWPDEVSQFFQSTEGRFTGVGIQISRRDGRLVVVTPLPDTPAQRAGIKAGDIIAEVDGKSTASWSLDRAVREIKGPEGSVVVLGIERAGEQQEVLPIEVRRAEIHVESIRGWQYADGGGWDFWIDAEDRIGYVRMSSFVEDAADKLDEAVAQMQADGPINGLILDLRYNPGGWLTAALEVVDRFIDKGSILYLVDASGERRDQPPARSSRTYRNFPVVVLINQGSASASEIVSGALQDHGRATVIGTRTFGKGSVQDVLWKPNRRLPTWGVKLTTQYYMLPMGRMIHRKPGAAQWGVEPDLTIEMTREQEEKAIDYRQKVDVLRAPEDVLEANDLPRAEAILEEGLDPQLSAALLVLKTQFVARDLAIAQARAQAPEAKVNQ